MFHADPHGDTSQDADGKRDKVRVVAQQWDLDDADGVNGWIPDGPADQRVNVSARCSCNRSRAWKCQSTFNYGRGKSPANENTRT